MVTWCLQLLNFSKQHVHVCCHDRQFGVFVKVKFNILNALPPINTAKCLIKNFYLKEQLLWCKRNMIKISIAVVLIFILLHVIWQLTRSVEAGHQRSSRSFHCWHPAPRYRLFPWLAIPGNPAMSSQVAGERRTHPSQWKNQCEDEQDRDWRTLLQSNHGTKMPKLEINSSTHWKSLFTHYTCKPHIHMRTSGYLLSSKTNISKFQFNPECSGV